MSDTSDTPPDGTPAVPPGDEPTRLDHQPIVVPAPAPLPGDAGGGGEVPPGPPPADDEGSNPWPWIIGGLLALIAVVALVLLLTGGDDDGDDEIGLEPIPGQTTTSTSSTTSSTTSTTTTAPPPTTTAPPATTTTDAPPVTADPAQCEEAGSDPDAPEPAAQAVFIAWTRGDENCAAQLMTPAARVELFSRDGSQATDVFQGCTDVDEPDPRTDCAFTFEGGSTHYLMNFSPTDGWTVFDIEQVAD